MKILGWDDFIASRELEPLSVTIGVFDGVHRGHQKLMHTVLARRPTKKSAVITFRENPKKILHPQAFKGSIFNLGQKIEVFGAMGFDACVLIDFSQNFATLSGAEFLSLLANAGGKFVCVGPNFRCGHKMDTNAQSLAEICRGLDMEAEIMEPVLHAGHPVSSSRIRNAILEGNLGEAAEMLGRPHTVELDGAAEDVKDGIAMKPATDSLLPPAGIYRVVIDPGIGNERVIARIGDGLIVAEAVENRAAKRIAIINLVSQECKEI
jgi:riboflavin kinase/FMN adenylyltransferase